MKTYTLKTTRISDGKVVESGHYRKWKDAENLQRDPLIEVLHSQMMDDLKTEVVEHRSSFLRWLMAC